MENNNEVAVFGGGCFWCTEAVFAEFKGVVSVTPGYAGGHTENPSYRQVCSETTGHAEVSRVQFDPSEIAFRDLLTVFFATHDPTTLNRQGADQGTQYRSVILYTNDDQKQLAEAFVGELNESGGLGGPVVTEIVRLEKFYEAEAEHKQYYMENPDSMYCRIVIDPKMKKFREKFAAQLR
ncbi:MAG: peptide-methionine (S)-S-oxide reductase [SAR202 cluster bacterium Casp-Chloro-G4]|nr:peptide-methionine (S)-S-oxide reductase MsrA [Chloroflexota bacterium]MDA1227116.1 peptide-methionine (S)-S-oxide reductase MsrA [Chloroflexota bacterium]PKB61501.1 MAG: peptide-methionine (S)-S-oxide reductase [SAR202 cluster bacterium Casp-Chloro-G4]